MGIKRINQSSWWLRIEFLLLFLRICCTALCMVCDMYGACESSPSHQCECNKKLVSKNCALRSKSRITNNKVKKVQMSDDRRADIDRHADMREICRALKWKDREESRPRCSYMSEHRKTLLLFCFDDFDGFRRTARGDGGLRTSCPPSFEILPSPRRQLEPPYPSSVRYPFAAIASCWREHRRCPYLGETSIGRGYLS